MKSIRSHFGRPGKGRPPGTPNTAGKGGAVQRYDLRSANALWQFAGIVALCAPDHFPVLDHLPAQDQLDLDAAYEILRRAVVWVYPDPGDENVRLWIYDALDRSKFAYAQGDANGGALILEDDVQALVETRLPTQD